MRGPWPKRKATGWTKSIRKQNSMNGLQYIFTEIQRMTVTIDRAFAIP